MITPFALRRWIMNPEVVYHGLTHLMKALEVLRNGPATIADVARVIERPYSSGLRILRRLEADGVVKFIGSVRVPWRNGLGSRLSRAVTLTNRGKLLLKVWLAFEEDPE